MWNHKGVNGKQFDGFTTVNLWSDVDDSSFVPKYMDVTQSKAVEPYIVT